MSPTRFRDLAVAVVAASLALAPLTASNAAAQKPAVNLNDLMNDTQKDTPDPNRITMVWWLPDEYWEAVLQEEAAEALSVLGAYVVISVVDGAIGPFGGVTFQDAASVRDRLRLVDSKGNTHTPLPQGMINADARSLLSMMRPILSNVAGPMGENFHFFVFAAGEGGKPLFRATEEGSFSVFVGEEEFAWRLPLGSLMPPKYCPVDGEMLSGAWTFCPWHGAELTLTRP